jgi:hypothetical protein
MGSKASRHLLCAFLKHSTLGGCWFAESSPFLDIRVAGASLAPQAPLWICPWLKYHEEKKNYNSHFWQDIIELINPGLHRTFRESWQLWAIEQRNMLPLCALLIAVVGKSEFALT